MTSDFPPLQSERLKIYKVTEIEEIPLDLLQLADPSRDKVLGYLKSGDCYVGDLDGRKVGAFIIEKLDNNRIEIKNIAVSEVYQNLGYGKQFLNFISTHSRSKGFKFLRICTGNSSIAQLALYQRVGFDLIDVKKGYFLENYDKEIWENGIRCKHLMVLEMEL